METTTVGEVTLTTSLTDALENFTTIQDQANTTAPTSVDDVPVEKYVMTAVTLLFLVLGLFGNCCTIIIMIRQNNTYSTHGVHLIALATADIISLLVVTINKPLIKDLCGVDLRAFSQTGCKLFKYIGRVAVICSSHFVVLICIERFIAVMFPLKAKFLLSKKLAYISISLISLTMFLVNIPNIIYTGVKNGVCLPDFAMEPNHPLPKAMSTMTLLLHTIIPTIILICLTPMILLQLYRQNMKRRQMGVVKSDVTGRITAMLISVVISYFLLICVFSIAFWLLTLTGVAIITSDSEWAKVFSAVYETAQLINYSFNFFLYGVTSRDFRFQICRMLGCTIKTASQNSLGINPDSRSKDS